MFAHPRVSCEANDGRPKVFLRESDLSHLPPCFRHPLTPVLYAESGSMPSSRGKRKKCTIVVNITGLSLLRSGSRNHGAKVATFISTFDITEIVWIDARRREVIGSRGSSWFQADHPDDAIAFLVASRSSLFLKSTDSAPIQLSSFPSPLPTLPLIATSKNLPQLLYISLCLRDGSLPHHSFVNFFASKETNFLSLDQTLEAPVDIRCLKIPMIRIGPITQVHFAGFAPFAVCRLLHFLLKSVPTVRVVVIENYESLVPAQLRLGKTITSTLSVALRRCSLRDSVLGGLLEQLGRFPGEFQRLSFLQIPFSVQNMKLLQQLLGTKCCRSLEILDLDDPDCSVDRLDTGPCRFLQRLSFSGWSPQLISFSHCPATELVLNRIDMTEALPILPLKLRLLDVSRSTFTSASLHDLLRTISLCRTPVTMIVADIAMPEHHWRTFYDGLSQLPPCASLHELDWSGNRLFGAVIPQFLEYFFSGGNLKFLSVGRIFRPVTAVDLESLLRGLPKFGLLGISIGGSPECNFSANFGRLMQALATMPEVPVLHVNCQRMSDADAQLFLSFLGGHKGIQEVSCDQSSMMRIVQFYRSLDGLGIPAVGHPVYDISRINGESDSKWLWSYFQNHFPATCPSVRAYYFSSPSYCGRAQPKELSRLASQFPLAYFSVGVVDPFGRKVPPVATLAALQTGMTSGGRLCDAQLPGLIAPTEPPSYCVGDVPEISPASARFSYKVVLDGINIALVMPFVREITKNLLRMEFRVNDDAVSVWVWGQHSPENPKYYAKAAAVFRRWTGNESTTWRVTIPSYALVLLIVGPADAEQARQFGGQNRTDVIELASFNGDCFAQEFRKFIARVHKNAAVQPYEPGSEFDADDQLFDAPRQISSQPESQPDSLEAARVSVSATEAIGHPNSHNAAPIAVSLLSSDSSRPHSLDGPGSSPPPPKSPIPEACALLLNECPAPTFVEGLYKTEPFELLLGGESFPIDPVALAGSAGLFSENPDMVRCKRYCVRTKAAPEVFAAFISALAGREYQITAKNIDGLEALALEFGAVEVFNKCAAFAGANQAAVAGEKDRCFRQLMRYEERMRELEVKFAELLEQYAALREEIGLLRRRLDASARQAAI
jgi:hypothetical protein